MLHAKMCFVSTPVSTTAPQPPTGARKTNARRLQPPHGSIFYIRLRIPHRGSSASSIVYVSRPRDRERST
jgi:hypothetical protein